MIWDEIKMRFFWRVYIWKMFLCFELLVNDFDKKKKVFRKEKNILKPLCEKLYLVDYYKTGMTWQWKSVIDFFFLHALTNLNAIFYCYIIVY